MLFANNIVSYAGVTDTVFYEIWNVNSVTNIGGHSVTVSGAPVVVSTEKGRALQFDGVDDILVVDNNPIGSATEFTFEVFFKPNGGQPNIANEPRFVCFWDPNDASGPRMTIEIRVTAANEWYFDGFLKTDIDAKTLIDFTKTHATNQWMHVAVTYKDKVFTTYVNGVVELDTTVDYSAKILNSIGKTSIGARFNNKNWYNGIIRAIKITHKALTPSEFFSIPDTVVTTNSQSIIKQDSKVEIYPNPAKEELYIRDMSRKKEFPLSLSIISISGKQVYKRNFSPFKNEFAQTIDVSHLNNGIYFVGLQYPGYCITHKISIMH
jgi:hypothetical protein